MPNDKSQMPVLFIGHGSPMNAIEDNIFSKGWRDLAQQIPRPDSILCISAHWETRGTLVTAMERPRTIHDFGGFPRDLYAVEYPAKGSAALADETIHAVSKVKIQRDQEWGLDHGCWSVLKQMYPEADIPVVQLSLDATKPARFHYELAKELAPLRAQRVLILGSGNIVHNLGMASLGSDDFNEPFGFDWAIEASTLLKQLINGKRHEELVEYKTLGKSVQLAIPTNEHYLPMLYAIALQQENENVSMFNDSAVAGSLTMTSLVISA